MHVPDGYLGPQTYVPLIGIFAVTAVVAAKKVRDEVSVKHIPYLGMAAAFSFIIMMFNLPVPGGTTGHAVGAAVIALILGPWSAVISVSVALIIQALIFGDGGITAIGANCFNMGVFMPFVSYYLFKIVRLNSIKKGRIFLASFLAGYFSLVLTAILTAVEFGIQPLIAVSAEGIPLYCPYGLKIAVPAMAIEHLIIFGVVEGLVTAFIVRYFFNNEPDLVYVLKNRRQK